jgi:serine phosphatase RsbU (regulator of sigma subunit)/HAMP domain-containing protein
VSSGNQVTIDKVLGIFNPVTGSNEINSSQLLEQIQKHFFRPGIQPLQIEDIARLAILQKTPIHFLFSRDDKKYCGTLYPSAAFSSGMFFLYQPISELYTPLRKEAAWLSFLFLLSILILGIPLNILFKRLINPLAVLGDGIKSLAQGEYSKRMPNQPVEDLQILADQFNEMAESVSIRIESLQSARGINDQLNQGRECTEIIQEVLTQICKSLHFDFGVAGFFEGSVSRDSRKYFWHECKEEPPDHEKILDLILSSRTSEDATLRISGEALAEAQLKEEHGLLIVSQPRETEEINIYGVLFLASSQKISNLLYLQNVVRHLRSVVVKDVLNQILSDSRKGEETQRALLPANPPPLPDEFELSHYFLAARRLAGDFYDFFLTPDQSHLIMIIADVAGKGIGSSLFGMTARTTFRLLCQKEYGTDLGGLLGELNEVMCAENFPYMFLTCFCLDLDLKSYEMKYSIAGHNKMLLARGDGSLDQLTSREIPLGLFEGIAFSEQQLALEPMDRLVLYTDGVTGMENSDLEIYGLKRLEAFVLNHLSLTSLEFQDALLKELEEFRQGVHAPDDLTLINLRRH